MTEQTPTKTLYIIDGLAQMFRAYHAIRTGLTSPVTGEPTNATFGYVGMLLKLFREYKPDYIALAIDKSGDRETFRSEIYPEYKANRPPPPIDFKPQVERCLEITELMGIPVLGEESVEADDVIATLVTRLTERHPDLRIRIVSKDKDLEQLLSERVEIADVHRDEFITPQTLKETKGITPQQVVDVLTLVGDTVDNVPGVPGIGIKTAAQLIGQYGTLDNLLAHLDEIKGKRRENIERTLDLLPRGRQLVTLKHDSNVDLDLESARVDPSRLPVDRLLEEFKTLGFTRHRQDLLALVGGEVDRGSREPEHGLLARASKGEHEASKRRGQAAAPADGLFAGLAEAAPVGPSRAVLEPKRGTYRCITTVAELDALIETLRRAPIVACDTETTHVSPMRAQLCGISLSIEEGTGVYIPVRSPTPEAHLDLDTVVERLRPTLEDPNVPKCGHNVKYDEIVLRRHGVRLAGVVCDTMVASYLVDAARSSHALDPLAQSVLGYHCIPLSDLIGERGRGKVQKRFDEVPLELACDYAAEDADVTLRLRNVFEPQINALGLRRLYETVEVPLVTVLAEMEYNGIRVDPAILDEQRAALAQRIEELKAEIVANAPWKFNPDSPKQLAVVLFNRPTDDPPGLGVRAGKRRKTGPSTDMEVLERLAADLKVTTPLPRLIVEYRQLTKLVNTYLVALKDCIHPETGRIHASFNQTVAATGRLSSSEPNLQNIPIRTDIGRRIRAAFVAEEDCQLITADYSQIELRLLAHLSDDAGLIAAFHADEDIHTAVASYVFNVPPGEVTRQQRNSAKMVNFGIIYGVTAFGLARRLGENTSNEEAAKIISDYKQRYPGIDEFLQRCVRQAEQHGYVETMLGRRRAIPQIKSRNSAEYSLGQRMAINSVVQGSAADLIKIAMIDLHRRLPSECPRVKMLLQIHDELVFESPNEDVSDATAFIVERMEAAMELKVPLKVEAAAARNWLEGK